MHIPVHVRHPTNTGVHNHDTHIIACAKCHISAVSHWLTTNLESTLYHISNPLQMQCECGLSEVHSGGSDGTRSVLPLGLYIEGDQNVLNVVECSSNIRIAIRMHVEYSDCSQNTRRIFGLQYTLNVNTSVYHLQCCRSVLHMCKTFVTP